MSNENSSLLQKKCHEEIDGRRERERDMCIDPSRLA